MILIAELDKELVIVPLLGFHWIYQTLKISKLFALHIVIHMQNGIDRRARLGKAELKHFPLLVSWCVCVCVCATIAISATSDHVTVSHNISSMKRIVCCSSFFHQFSYFVSQNEKLSLVACKSRLRGLKEVDIFAHRTGICSYVCERVVVVTLLFLPIA